MKVIATEKEYAGYRRKQMLKSAGESALLTAAFGYIGFKPEVRAAIKNTIRGEDKFVDSAVKNAKKSGLVKDLAKVAENAKKIYPETVQTGKAALKSLGKAAATVIVAVTAINLIADKISGGRSKKDNQ